jgi:hypothetical protein
VTDKKLELNQKVEIPEKKLATIVNEPDTN